MWHQGFKFNFTKLRGYLLYRKKTKIMTLFNSSSPPHLLCVTVAPFWRVSTGAADTEQNIFIQSDLQMRKTEAIKANKRAIIWKWNISLLVLYFSFAKKHAAFCPSNNKRTHFLNREIKIVSRINLWVEWIVTSLSEMHSYKPPPQFNI